MLRRLLNIASIVCLVLCVALMGMWVRSYRWMTTVDVPAPRRSVKSLRAGKIRFEGFEWRAARGRAEITEDLECNGGRSQDSFLRSVWLCSFSQGA